MESIKDVRLNQNAGFRRKADRGLISVIGPNSLLSLSLEQNLGVHECSGYGQQQHIY